MNLKKWLLLYKRSSNDWRGKLSYALWVWMRERKTRDDLTRPSIRQPVLAFGLFSLSLRDTWQSFSTARYFLRTRRLKKTVSFLFSFKEEERREEKKASFSAFLLSFIHRHDLNLKFWVRASKPQTSSLAVDGRVFEWGKKEGRKKTERKTERESKTIRSWSFFTPSCWLRC